MKQNHATLGERGVEGQDAEFVGQPSHYRIERSAVALAGGHQDHRRPSRCCWQYQSMPSTGWMKDWRGMVCPGRCGAGRSDESINLINNTLIMRARNATPERSMASNSE